MNDLVTVYIITHNRRKLLERCLTSVQCQSYENIEIIIVDDASTDDTESFLSSITDNRVKYIRNSVNSGACFSRNRAIKLASGIFITGCDDDDYFENDRIQNFIENKELLEYNSLLFTHNKWLTNKGMTKPKIDKYFTGRVGLKKLLYFNFIGNQVFCKTSSLTNVLFDESMPAWQDLDCWYRLVKYENLPAIKLAKDTYVQDISHEFDRITNSRKHKILQAYMKFCKKNGLGFFSRLLVKNHLFLYKINRKCFLLASIALLCYERSRFSLLLVLRNFKMAFIK